METFTLAGGSPIHSHVRRPTLTRRKPGIENLIAGFPFDVPDKEDLRRFAMNTAAAASAWQVRRAKADNALARQVAGKAARHG